MATKKIDWNAHAKQILKSEMMRRGITNEALVLKLKDIGVKETKSSVESKIYRGTFSAAFFLQCLNALGIKNLNAEITT